MSRIDLFVVVNGNGSTKTATFRAESTSGIFPPGEVSLARKPDHCFFGLDNLEAHGVHAPAFSSKAGLEGYIDRVTQSVNSLINDYLATKTPTSRKLGTWEVEID